jgi:hypothetical protein
MAIIAMQLPSCFPHLQSSPGVIMAAALASLAGRDDGYDITCCHSTSLTVQGLNAFDDTCDITFEIE